MGVSVQTLRDTGEGYIVNGVDAERSDAVPSERVTLRLGAFVLVLAAIFGVGFGLGAAIGPEPSEAPAVVDDMDGDMESDMEHEGEIHGD